MGLFDHISIFNKEITPLSYLSFPVPVYTPSTTWGFLSRYPRVEYFQHMPVYVT